MTNKIDLTKVSPWLRDLADEILELYNKQPGKEWFWYVGIVYNRHKNNLLYRKGLKKKDFNALVTPVCQAIQPPKKKADAISLQGAKEHHQEYIDQWALIGRDPITDEPIGRDD